MSNHASSISLCRGRKHLVRAAAALLCALSAAFASPPAAGAAELGDVTTFATLPAAPGFPEGIAVHGNRVYVSGAATFGTAGAGPSKIFVFRKSTGALLSTIEVVGETLAAEHALSCIAVDAFGRIYALSTQLGVLRFTRWGHHHAQESYGAPLPDLPTCDAASPGADCTPTPVDLPPLSNDIVFDEDGFAYVTDSFQGTIFRYAPGGGAPHVWLQSPLFAGGGPLPFGVNGIRLNPERTHVYVSVTFSTLAAGLGSIYRVPLVDAPGEADIEWVHDYDAGEGPDGFAFGRSGRLYVTLAMTNEISVLAPDGAEEARFGSAPGSDIPLDAPANVVFDNATRSLLIVNHALLTGNASHFAVLKTFVGEKGDRLEEPCVR